MLEGFLKETDPSLLQLRALHLRTGPSFFHTLSDASPISRYDALASDREAAVIKGTVTGSLRACPTRGRAAQGGPLRVADAHAHLNF